MKLRPGENLIYKTRPHWIVFGWAVWPAWLAGRLFAATNYARNGADAQMWFNLAWTFGVLAGMAVILAQFYRWSSRFILTDRHVVLGNGILRQRSTEFPLRNVESVLVEFPILGRLFNYGTVTVRGFGGSRDSIKRVPKPERVRELIEDGQTMTLMPHSNWISAAEPATAGRPRPRVMHRVCSHERQNGRSVETSECKRMRVLRT